MGGRRGRVMTAAPAREGLVVRLLPPRSTIPRARRDGDTWGGYRVLVRPQGVSVRGWESSSEICGRKLCGITGIWVACVVSMCGI